MNANVTEVEEFSIPLNISDLIIICKEFNKLGYNMQNQIDSILDLGVQESLNTGILKKESIPFIKNFLNTIETNPYFGDASWQAKEALHLLDEYLAKNTSTLN